MPTLSIASLLRSRWSWLALCYLVIPFILRPLPLSGEIQYEFAALVAVLASVLSALVPLLAPDDATSPLPAPDGNRLWWLAVRTLPSSLIPLCVYLLFVPFCEQCGFGEGILWYLLLVLPSAAIGTILGASIASMVKRRWLRFLAFVGIWSLSLLRGGFEAADGPHIFLYAWQVGFYPGGSWDAELPIPSLLLVYRAWHLLVALALGSLVAESLHLRSGNPPRPATLAVCSVLAIASLILIPARSDLGLTRTDSWLRTELGDSLRTRYATLYFNARGADSLDLWRAANYTDFHIRQQATLLGLTPEQVEPVALYLYSSASEQKRLVGTSSASFTKPWKRMIHLAFDRVASTLEHELVHVMIEPFGNLLGISVSQGLLEGSAVAVENDIEWRSIHSSAAALYSRKMAPPPERIMGVSGFTAQRSSVAYLIAGSFSRWLIDTYGIPKYLRAFAWGDFDDAYGRSLESLSTTYMQFITQHGSQSEGSFEPAALRYYYGGGSFFYQRCLRRLGSLNAQGFRALAEERYDAALERFRESMEEGITYTARSGVLRALFGSGSYRTMLDSAAVYAQDTASYPLLPYLIEQGDARWALGDISGAAKLYDSVDRLAISISTATRVALRKFFLLDSSGLPTTAGLNSIAGSRHDVANVMRTYFSRAMPAMQRLEILDRVLRKTGDPDQISVLSLMKATLLAPSLPRTAAAIVRSVEQLRLGAHDWNPAVMLLRYGLRDAMLYDQLLSGHDRRSLLVVTNYRSPEPELLQKRIGESNEFRDFLRYYAILP